MSSEKASPEFGSVSVSSAPASRPIPFRSAMSVLSSPTAMNAPSMATES